MIHQFYFWGFFARDKAQNGWIQITLKIPWANRDWWCSTELKIEVNSSLHLKHFILLWGFDVWASFFFIKIKEIFLQKLIQENIFLIENPMNESNQLVKNKRSNCLFFSCDSSRRDLWCRRGWCAESRGSIVKIFS